MQVPERYNVSTLVDDNLEAGRGDNVAIRYEDQQVTYAQLHERMCRAGHALRALGMQPEQRVIFAMDDSPAWPRCSWPRSASAPSQCRSATWTRRRTSPISSTTQVPRW